jgi:hypothetical protein
LGVDLGGLRASIFVSGFYHLFFLNYGILDPPSEDSKMRMESHAKSQKSIHVMFLNQFPGFGPGGWGSWLPGQSVSLLGTVDQSRMSLIFPEIYSVEFDEYPKGFDFDDFDDFVSINVRKLEFLFNCLNLLLES